MEYHCSHFIHGSTTIPFIFQQVLNSSSCDRYGTDIHLNPQEGARKTHKDTDNLSMV
jgi:hypothetical protein